MTEPLISVIIPTRNRAATVVRALNSVLTQVEVDLEVVIVDDASQDETLAVLSEHVDERIKIVHHDSARGPSASRNSGATQTAGTWLAFCDDDDIWAPNKLSVQLEALVNYPEADWCGCGAMWVDQELGLLRYMPPPPSGDIANVAMSYNPLPGGGSGTIVRSSTFRQVGGFDPELWWGEDWDLWIRMSLQTPLVTVDQPLVAYVVHESNASSHFSNFSRDATTIENKYRQERSERQVSIDFARIEGTQAEIDLKAHRQFKATAHYLRQATLGGGLASIKRAVASLLMPRVTTHRRTVGHLDDIPPLQRLAVESWLSNLKPPAKS